MRKGGPRRTFNDPGHAHELTFSTFRRTKLLTDDRFCTAFLENLDRARKALDFEVWAYVLMPDHVHLLLWPKLKVYDMADIRQSIKQPVSQFCFEIMRNEMDMRLPRLHDGTKARFWQTGGGYDRNLYSKEACMKSIDYIHNNPVVAGLVKLPWEYRWSSSAWYQGLGSDFEVDRAKY